MGAIVVTDNINRNLKEIIEINPFNNKYVKLLESYDLDNNTNYLKILGEIKGSLSEDSYELNRMIFPCFKALYCSYDGDSISNVCYVECDMDLKCIKIYLDNYNKSICDDITSFSFRNLNMEEVFIIVDKKYKNIIDDLLNNQYIPLYDDNDYSISFLKEKIDYVNHENIVCI